MRLNNSTPDAKSVRGAPRAGLRTAMAAPATGKLMTGKLMTVLAICSCSLVATGCGMLGGNQQVKQLQLDNDRLLSEYRAQRDRLAALQETNAALEARLNESEKLLARLGQAVPAERISRADLPPRSSNSPGTLATGSSSRSPMSGSNASRGSVPDGGGSGGSAPGTEDSLQWRPMRRQ
jgi:hypothetical protein